MQAAKVTHTPGPWAFKEGNAERASMSEVFKAVDKEFRIGFVTCENRSQQQRAEDIANARLIAAAPELLAAVATMLGAAEADCLDDKSNVWRSAMIDARAAIAKVEGGAGDRLRPAG